MNTCIIPTNTTRKSLVAIERNGKTHRYPFVRSGLWLPYWSAF